MIIGEDIIKKLDSLPERHKGMYVSEVLARELRREEDIMNKASSLVVPAEGNFTKATFEEYLRKMIREELIKV
jgi:hypothetical protein